MAADEKIAFIGAGAMGGAIARGLVECGLVAPGSLGIADPGEDVRRSFEALGAASWSDAAEMIAEFDPATVFIAVKPQILDAVVRPLARPLAGRLVVSIAAGVTIAALEELLPESRIVRTMPNLPMQKRLGAAAVTGGASASPADVERAAELLGGLGEVRVMREDQLDVAGIVSGCAPAFFALFADQLARAGVKAGLAAADARAMVLATMQGSAAQMIEDEIHPRVYMERVTSPGGTTAAALAAMEPFLFEAVHDAVDAALERTAELACR